MVKESPEHLLQEICHQLAVFKAINKLQFHVIEHMFDMK